MKKIDEIKLHPLHREEIEKAAMFLINRGWAEDPVVVTSDESVWHEIQKDSHVWSFLRGFSELKFYGHKSHIQEKTWLNGKKYFWFVIILPVNPDEIEADPEETEYLVIDQNLIYLHSEYGMIDYLLKEF
jgi:hypothetical protein